MSHDFSYDYLSAKPVGHGNGSSSNHSKIENYKRIKQEEAAARAQLMAPSSRDSAGGSGQKAPRQNIDLGALAAHRRNPSLLDRKYKPSENAFAAYSPLRNEIGGHHVSQQALPQFVPSIGIDNSGVISSMELKGLRGII